MTSFPKRETSNQPGDADPMIDALLAEFLPSDPNQRRPPPDLSRQIMTQLEAISESHRTASTRSASAGKSTRTSAPRPAPAEKPAPASISAGSRPAVARVATLIVSIAACLAVAVWLAGNDSATPSDDSEPLLAGGPSDPAVAPQPEPEIPTNDLIADSGEVGADEEPAPEQPRKRIKGIPLNDPNVAVSPQRSGLDLIAVDPNDHPNMLELAPLDASVARLQAATNRYWTTLGIEPTAEAPPSQVAERISDRLGVSLSEDRLNDPTHIQSQLAKSDQAAEIAKRWLATVTETPLTVFEGEQYGGLVGEVAEGFSGSETLQTKLVSLIDGSNPHSNDWYRAVGRGGPERIARRLARVSMNADMRCVRCHDSMIGRAGTQDDYWSFVALVRNSIERGENGWTVKDEPSQSSTFFELPDGRQRMAHAGVSERFLPGPSAGQTDLKSWAAALGNSDQLADSIVDSLWELVHGRPLSPNPVDAFAPPMNASLQELHDQLSDDLRASRFDVTRTLALILSSPTVRRTVPEALLAENLLTTTDQQRAEALERVNAFAAAVDTPDSSRRQRIELALRRTGGKLQDDGTGSLLAQPMLKDSTSGTPGSLSSDAAPSFQQLLSTDFPGNDAELPVSWLRSINDYDDQVQHLVYLSGGEKVTDDIASIAKQLRESGTRESALSRLWWILRK